MNSTSNNISSYNDDKSKYIKNHMLISIVIQY